MSRSLVVTVESCGELAQVLRDRRERLGLSQRALAKMVGTQQSAVSDWESGLVDPVLGSLLKWVSALDVEVQFVLPEKTGV